MGILTALKLPLKLLVGLVGKRQKKRTELEEKWSRSDELSQKQIKHVRNFAPTHYSWQKSIGKDKRKRKSRQKSNTNFRQGEVKKVDRRVATKKIRVNLG